MYFADGEKNIEDSMSKYNISVYYTVELINLRPAGNK